MTPTAHHHEKSSAVSLYVALELSAEEWRLAYSVSQQAPATQVVVPAGDRVQWERVMGAALAQHGLAGDATIWSCYEAGRDGFWVHRWLAAAGVHNVVVDSSSIEVNRRARRAKTDRLDAAQLLRLVIRTHGGERDVWRVVPVPSAATEDARQAGRTLSMLKQERTRFRNRVHQVLATQPVTLAGDDPAFVAQLATASTAVGTPVGPGLRMRLAICHRVLQVIEELTREVEAAQHAALRAAETPVAAGARKLAQVRGVGERFAWVLSSELCARDLQNRRQVGALTGFTPVPYQSGASARDPGVSGAGIPAIRELAVEMAWVWVQWQPDSAITRWFHQRFAQAGRRGRRVGIVAVARRLVIAVWRYHRDDVLPAGAVLRADRQPA